MSEVVLSRRPVVQVEGIPLTPGMGYSEALEVLRSVEHFNVDAPIDRLLAPALLRRRFIANFGFSIITSEELDILERLLRGKRVLEAAAGSGYLSRLLCDRGLDVTASDCGGWSRYGVQGAPPYQRDHEGNSLAMVDGQFEAVVVSWPPMGDTFAVELAGRMAAGQILIHLGEGKGGCTGDHDFFTEISDQSRWMRMGGVRERLNRVHLRFDGMKDGWEVLVRL